MAGVGGKEADLQAHSFLSRTKDRLLMANTQLLALSPRSPLLAPPKPPSPPGPGSSLAAKGLTGISGAGTGLCLAACQTLFSRGRRERGRVGEEEPQPARS